MKIGTSLVAALMFAASLAAAAAPARAGDETLSGQARAQETRKQKYEQE
ncbi:MAG TPA: hypothetical protein VNL14_02085 [Candidatus Acidoferrales bacterium]|nr:hypothetical protein [Candidatus Acidoferrales bacterium]